MQKSSLREKLHRFAAWLELNEKAKGANGLLQFVAAASATLYVIYPAYGNWFARAFIVSMVPVLLSSLMTLGFYRRSGLNVLHFDRETGFLYDEKTHFLNVALRRETMQRIIMYCEEHSTKDDVKMLGYSIGKNFINRYRETPDRAMSNEEQVLKKVFEYDSSSGMGRFEVLKDLRGGRKREIDIEIWNPFVEEEGEELSAFLQGYILGVCSEVLGGHFTLKGRRKRTQGRNHIFELTIGES